MICLIRRKRKRTNERTNENNADVNVCVSIKFSIQLPNKQTYQLNMVNLEN